MKKKTHPPHPTALLRRPNFCFTKFCTHQSWMTKQSRPIPRRGRIGPGEKGPPRPPKSPARCAGKHSPRRPCAATCASTRTSGCTAARTVRWRSRARPIAKITLITYTTSRGRWGLPVHRATNRTRTPAHPAGRSVLAAANRSPIGEYSFGLFSCCPFFPRCNCCIYLHPLLGYCPTVLYSPANPPYLVHTKPDAFAANL